MTKAKFKVLLALAIICIAMLAFNINIVRAEDEQDDSIYFELFIGNEENKNLGYYSPLSGGGAGKYDIDYDYSNCTYTMIIEEDINLPKEIETELGTFTYEGLGWWDDEGNGGGSTYSCPVNNPNYISSLTQEETILYFTTTNVDTNEEVQLATVISVFKKPFNSNANLKVNDVDIIVNGELVNDCIFDDDMIEVYCVYYIFSNRLELRNNFEGKVTYSNMGETFEIKKDENCKAEVICEDDNKPVTDTNTETNIKLEADEGIIPSDTILEVEPVTEGTTYNNVKTALASVKDFVVYDITLKSKGVAIQPNGKVKISIPIPNDFDNSKLVVYRISDNGEKVEYNVTIEGDYATFETDHFSTYVLAEKIANNTYLEKDNTPKTGTENIIGYASIVTIISALGIITFRKKTNRILS